MTFTQAVALFAFLGAMSVSASAQAGPFDDDLKGLTTNGKVINNVYSNAYAGFRLILPQPPCDPKLNKSVDARRGHAILLDCVHVVKGWGGMYTFTIALDYRVNYPSLQSVEHYVRRLRRSAESDPSLKTIETEQHRKMAALDFVQAILSTQIPAGTYYQGIACTQLKGYLLCFHAAAPSIDAVRSLLSLDKKLELTAKSRSKQMSASDSRKQPE